MSNSIIDLDNFVLNNYGYDLEPHQSQLLVAVAGIADLATSGKLDDRNVEIGVEDTDNIAEQADDVAIQIYNFVEPALPYFSEQTVYENVLFATLVGINIENDIDLEERAGHFIGEFLSAQQSIQRTDTIVDTVEKAGKTPISDKYTNLDWAMFYLESLIILDQQDEELNSLTPKSRASKRAWDIIDGYRYATVVSYDLDS